MPKSLNVPKVFKSVWLMPILVICFLVIVTKGQLLRTLYPILRFVWPLLLVWLVWRGFKLYITKKLQNIMKNAQQNARIHVNMNPNTRMNMNQQYGRGRGFSPGAHDSRTVIEICPKCGTAKEGDRTHHCSTTDRG